MIKLGKQVKLSDEGVRENRTDQNGNKVHKNVFIDGSHTTRGMGVSCCSNRAVHPFSGHINRFSSFPYRLVHDAGAPMPGTVGLAHSCQLLKELRKVCSLKKFSSAVKLPSVKKKTYGLKSSFFQISSNVHINGRNGYWGYYLKILRQTLFIRNRRGNIAKLLFCIG